MSITSWLNQLIEAKRITKSDHRWESECILFLNEKTHQFEICFQVLFPISMQACIPESVCVCDGGGGRVASTRSSKRWCVTREAGDVYCTKGSGPVCRDRRLTPTSHLIVVALADALWYQCARVNKWAIRQVLTLKMHKCIPMFHNRRHWWLWTHQFSGTKQETIDGCQNLQTIPIRLHYLIESLAYIWSYSYLSHTHTDNNVC